MLFLQLADVVGVCHLAVNKLGRFSLEKYKNDVI